MTTARTKLGSLGEHHARLMLEAAGMTFIGANWRCAAGELDLVMRDRDMIVMVEVKVRRGESRGSAEEAISAGKGRKLLATGEWFMSAHDEVADLPWRIDLVAITLSSNGAVVRRTHVPDAVVFG